MLENGHYDGAEITARSERHERADGVAKRRLRLAAPERHADSVNLWRATWSRDDGVDRRPNVLIKLATACLKADWRGRALKPWARGFYDGRIVPGDCAVAG